ncbi:MAG: transporter substrate-binding domain-containing protein [Dongiaceae bacterium]
MKRLITAFAAFAMTATLAAAAHADKLQDIISKGVVRIGVPLDVPPFGSQDANRNPVGLDVDLAQGIAKALGVKIELQPITSANRIPYLVTDKVDIVIAAMGMTPERAKQVMFTAPYADTYDAVYGPKSLAISSADQLGDHKVAATKGTTQDLELSAMNPKTNFLRTEDDATAAAAYMSGQAELFATNSLVVQELMKQNAGKEFDRKFVLARGPAHMAVAMSEQNLLNWLNTYIYSIMMSGELDQLTRKWLGHPYEPLPPL